MRLRYSILLLLIPAAVILPSKVVPANAQTAVLFQKTWGGSLEDSVSGIATDSAGNIYVSGSTHGNYTGCLSPPCTDISLLKYSSTGNLVMQKKWGGPNEDGAASGLVLDPAGYLYIAGSTASYGAGGSCSGFPCYDIVLLKLDTSGNVVWQRTWGGGGQDDTAGAIAEDSSGNIYVAGSTAGSGAGGYDVVLLKFNSTGSLLWQKTWGGSNDEFARSVALDSSGNIYVSAYTSSFTLGLIDAALLKFDSSGNLVWQRLWGGTKSDLATGVAVDTSNTIYLTGRTSSFGAGGPDLFLLRFDSNGNLLWQKTLGGNGLDSGTRLVADASGGIYVTGYTTSYGINSPAVTDALLLKFDQLGNLQTHLTWGGSGDDYGGAIALDFQGNLLIGGYVNETPPYSLGTFGNSTLGTPTFSARTTGNSTLGVPTYALGSAINPTSAASGSETYAGLNDAFILKYGLLPKVTFYTNPVGGAITFNGTSYTFGQSGNYTYGNATAQAIPPAGYVFSSWNTTGGVTVTGSTSNPTTAKITGPGTLTARYRTVAAIPAGVALLAAVIAPLILILRRRKLE